MIKKTLQLDNFEAIFPPCYEIYTKKNTTAHDLHERNYSISISIYQFIYYDRPILYREALDRLCDRLNM